MLPEEFLAVASALPEPLFFIARSGAILAANPAALQVLKARREQVDGHPLAELVAESEAALSSLLTSCERSTRFSPGRLTLRTASGERLECRTEGARVDGGLLLRATPEDVPAHAPARQSAGRLRLEAVLDHSAAAIYLKDAGGRYVVVNRRFEELTRISRAAIVGRTDYDLFPAGPADIIRHNDRLIVERNEPMEFEENVILPGGSRTFLSLKFPVPDPVNGLRCVGGISTDITERKRMQEQLRETQKLESLGVLAGGVAHDFNNLLTGILGNASIALETIPPDSPARAAMEEVLEAAERAAQLTRQMLAYAGKARSAVERIDLSRAVREIAGLVRLSVPRNVTLRLELAPDLPPVEADPGQLQQVVMNLVINGAEAVAENKTGTVVVTTGIKQLDAAYIRDHLRGEAAAPGLYVFLEVHDTGTGMDEATRSRIFDPFFTTKLSGRGLGLSAVQGIIRGHKGAIRVSSVPGMGTTFKILLPVAGAAVAPGVSGEEATETAGGGRVLVVDDEEVARRAAKSVLEYYGYTVLTAENGAEAIEILRSSTEAIRLVLLDYTMPVMTVEETLQQIRQVKPDIPVLLSSGYDRAHIARRFTEPGIAGFIQKPYRGTKLAQTIRQALRAA